MLEVSPVIIWDHDGLAAVLGIQDITYGVTLHDSADSLLHEESGIAGDRLDLAEAGLILPEGESLQLQVLAHAEGEVIEALQGTITFYVDATPPALSAALLESGLFLDYFELGVLASERMALLQALAISASGDTLAEFAADEGERVVGGDGELYYLRAQLHEELAQVLLHGEDLHGQTVDEALATAAASVPEGGLELSDALLSWSGEGPGWVVMLGRRLDDPALDLPAGRSWNALQLRFPESLERARIDMPYREGQVLARRDETGRWLALSQRSERGRAIGELRESGIVALVDENAATILPAGFRLAENHPNPFNPETWLRFELPEDGRARLAVYNIRGQRVRLLEDRVLQAGFHRLRWDGRGESGQTLASGLYIAALQWEGRLETTKMLLVR